MAQEAGLPLVSHVRDAHADAAEVLRSSGHGRVGGVIHCFTGGVAEARVYLDLGHHLSFSGILTFKTADAIREAAAFAPLDRILVETDAPYLAPIPYRGKRNEPAYIASTLAALAALRGLPVADVDAATTSQHSSFVQTANRALTRMERADGYSLVPRELQRSDPYPAPIRGLRHLHREVRAERHPRRRVSREPDASSRRYDLRLRDPARGR